ncbi:MAG TPA: hypothetical protein VMC80_00710 [Patescibacteria group bacterium]|nr:hypothetical protein [Patescibacteria group bacterium]
MSGVGIAIGVILALIVIIWVSAEFKRAKHKFLAIFLVAVILFIYFSATSVFSGKNVDLKSIGGITDAFKIYFSWLGSAFGSVQTFTSNAVKGLTNTTK